MAHEPPFAEFFVSHHVGDYLLQTDFQALHKAKGLSADAEARRALVAHALTYTAAFVPSLVGVARRRGLGRAAAVAAAIALPHVAIDDGRLVKAYMERVKGGESADNASLRASVDQSLHMACLWAAARVAALPRG